MWMSNKKLCNYELNSQTIEDDVESCHIVSVEYEKRDVTDNKETFLDIFISDKPTAICHCNRYNLQLRNAILIEAIILLLNYKGIWYDWLLI